MLSIRPATRLDVPDLLPLNRIVQEWHATHYPDRFRVQIDPSAITTFFETITAQHDTFVDLARWDGAAVGYCLARLKTSEGGPFTLPFRHLHVEHLCVAPDFRRRGIATAIVERTKCRARDLGCSEVNLTSWSDNISAHKAFRATGLETRRLWMALAV